MNIFNKTQAPWFGFLSIALTFALGCSSNGTPQSDTGKSDGTVTDGASEATLDSSPDSQTVAPISCNNDCNDYVFSRIIVPSIQNGYAEDLDKNGTTDNRLGSLLKTLESFLSEDASLQTAVDQSVYTGETVILLRIQPAKALEQAPTSSYAQTWIGKAATPACCDLASAAGDLEVCKTEAEKTCFGGSYSFSPVDKNKLNVFSGSISDKTAFNFGPADLELSIPLSTGKSIQLKLTRARFSGTIGENGALREGFLRGGVEDDVLKNDLLPGIVSVLNDMLLDPEVSGKTKDGIKSFLDKKEPFGQISTEEITGNVLISALLEPDVDLDGDGKVESLSLGIGFESVPAMIDIQ